MNDQINNTEVLHWDDESEAARAHDTSGLGESITSQDVIQDNFNMYGLDEDNWTNK